jgi:hypothetical protein
MMLSYSACVPIQNHSTVRNFDSQGTVMKPDARRPEPNYLLEVD